MSKAFVCTCEDVTVDDVRHAIALGHPDVESVKRYTGFGTGVCQGKNCLNTVARMIAKEGGLRQEQILPFTPRPPGRVTSFGELRGLDLDRIGPPGPGVPPPLGVYEQDGDSGEPGPGSHPLRRDESVPARASVVIIGAGVMGLGLAWQLCKRGVKDVVVLDKSYLCGGASGRNGGGVRAQWSTPTNIRLARRSIELCRAFAGEFGINIWFRQGGYLFLATEQERARQLDQAVKLHEQHGLATRLLSSGGAQELVPELDGDRIVAAAYNPDDGVLFPWPFVWGYAQGAQKLGASVHTYTKVTAIDTDGGLVRRVRTDRGDIECDTVVLAAGAWSPAIAQLCGVKLPNVPHKHEICATEPLKPWLGPLVSVLGQGLYFSQSMRGEIVGGMGDPHEPPGLEMGSTLRFLARYSKAITDCVPRLDQVKVIRQWAGCYDVTPDNQPILGETPGLQNLLQLNGFVGHGFMMAPAVTEAMAVWMTGGDKDEIFERFTLGRFAEGRLEREEFIIG